MTDGRLLMRVRAWEREREWEEAWGPEFVGNELAGTNQARDRHRRDAAMRRAEAKHAADDAERARLMGEAVEAESLADVLARRAAELAKADEARALWFAHTAETRAAADRARQELSKRAVDTEPVEMVTADERLDVHNRHTVEEDAYREVTEEHDLTDVTKQREEDLAVVTEQHVTDQAEPDGLGETGVADVRDLAAEEPAVVHSEEVRVPSAAETANSVDHAQRALREIQSRELADAQRAAEEAQATEMYRRHTVDAADAAAADEDAADEDAAVAS
jgi:hypothetical protein